MAAESTPLVYIVVLSWNGKADTIACLASLSKVSYQRFKTVLVDNASTDGTVDAVRSEFPECHVIVNTANLRYAGGNNRGISYAMERGADMIALLNNDTIVDPEFLDHLAGMAAADATIGMAGPKILYLSDRERIWYAGGKIDWRQGWVSHRGIREIDAGQYDTSGPTDYISGCCLLVKREVVEKVGMLDESYFIYGEDADWCVRTERAGYGLLYVPRARIWHRVSAASGGFSWFKNRNKLKSQIRFLIRYARWYDWFTIPFGFVWNVVKSTVKMRGW